jgi:hypothetical protein
VVCEPVLNRLRVRLHTFSIMPKDPSIAALRTPVQGFLSTVPLWWYALIRVVKGIVRT